MSGKGGKGESDASKTDTWTGTTAAKFETYATSFAKMQKVHWCLS